jgi:hypothetical protein
MDDQKYKVLLSLILLTLLVSAVSLMVTLSRGSKTGKQDSELSSDLLQTPAHLYTSVGPKSGPAIARVGDKEITKQELVEQFKILPPEMSVPFTTRPDTLNFLRQYVGLELIYEEAIHQGLGKDPALLAQLQDTKKQLMVDKYLADRLELHNYQPSEEQIKQFFRLNKDRFSGRKLEEARSEVLAHLNQQHQRKAYQDLVDELWQKSKVEIYEDSL